MKKRLFKKLAILAAPIVWRKIRGRRSRHRWHGRFRGHKRRGIWL